MTSAAVALERWAKRRPDAIAVVAGGMLTTYAALARLVNVVPTG